MSSPEFKFELLNHETILSYITPENRNALTKLEIFETIDSTNSYLLERAKNSEKSGYICFAEQQTEGRGRLGKKWFSPKGANLYFSLLWYFSPTTEFSTLSLFVSVVILRALKKYGVAHDIKLKWPNDILYLQRKLGGILIESIYNPHHIPVVIGVGINVKLPSDYTNAWIDLFEITGGQSINRNFLAGLILNELMTGLSIYAEQGFAPFIAEWRAHDFLNGKEIFIQHQLETYSGVAMGITNDGQLIVKMKNEEERKFICGEVSVKFS